ncbi:hypothetical protein DMUE_4694 [Dictyocoela muelleri]|nr:hypothetical protein DMUE_4694 [Dictyocoela muelleri]
MGSLCSCGAKPIFRLILQGNDNTGKKIIYSKLTNEDKKYITLDEKMIHIYETDFLLGKEIKKNVSKHSRRKKIPFGVIFVIDMLEADLLGDVIDDFEAMMQDNILENMNVLVLCNKHRGSNEELDGIFWNYLNYSNLKIVKCDIENWLGIDQGLSWLCHKIVATYEK